jgi:MYXO-CTERM domain-containing protein
LRHYRRALTRLLLAVTAMAVLTVGGAAGAQASTRPYPDVDVIGGITLCAQNGAQLTSGSIATKPFVWRAVGSTAAPAGYQAGGTATLYAFQPRRGVDPGDWSGEQLTASARYSSVAHPTAAATYADYPLRTFLGDYPAGWNGYVQLRLYLSAPGQSPASASYDAADIQVSGGTWRLLDGGPADCAAAGRAESLETVTLPAKELRRAKKVAQDIAAHPAPAAAPRNGGLPSTAPATPTTATAHVTASSVASDSHSGRNLSVVFALALLAAAAAFGLRRRS